MSFLAPIIGAHLGGNEWKSSCKKEGVGMVRRSWPDSQPKRQQQWDQEVEWRRQVSL